MDVRGDGEDGGASDRSRNRRRGRRREAGEDHQYFAERAQAVPLHFGYHGNAIGTQDPLTFPGFVMPKNRQCLERRESNETHLLATLFLDDLPWVFVVA